MTSKVRVDTSEWVRANNGNSPRGRAQWMFRNQAEWNVDTMETMETSFVTYTTARNQAREWAEENGWPVVWVCR